MKTLIGIVNCHSRDAYVDAQRETWIPYIPPELDYKVFRGRGSTREPKPDEVFLYCGDDYCSLPSKVQAMCRWALEHEIDFLVKLDDDVVFRPKLFVNSGYQNYDFTGHLNCDNANPRVPWGFCYTLSKRAMEFVASSSLPGNGNDEAWVSNVLHIHGISLHNENRFRLYTGKQRDFISNAPRPLRAPPRDRPFAFRDNLDEHVDEKSIAWAMYIIWLGYRNVSQEKNIETMRKVFKETQLCP